MSQLLARSLPTSAREVAEALGKVVEDEQKQRDAEAEYKRSQASVGRDTWATKPVLSEYCGLREAEGHFYIAEVKNAGYRCPDFDATPLAAHACADCRHEMRPSGPGRDERREQVYVRLGARNISADVKKDTTDSLLNNYRQGKAARQALEISGAYQSKGTVLEPPVYLSYCSAFSTPNSHVLCLFQNPHDACPTWQARPDRGDAPMHTPPTSVIPPVFGQRSAPDEGTAPDAQDASGHESPELERIFSMFGWLLDIPIDQSLHHALLVATATWSPEDTQSLMELAAYADDARSQGPDREDFMREAYQAEFVGQLRAGSEHDPCAAALISAYDADNPPIADGTPPLTMEVADAYLGILSFVDAIMDNRPWAPMGASPRAEFIEQMAAAYPALAPQEQAWLAAVPLEWARTRALWMQASDEDRQALATQLVALYGETAQATPVLASADEQVVPPVFGATSRRSSSAPSRTSAAAAPSDSPVHGSQPSSRDLLAQIMAEQTKEEEELLATDPELALQVKLQNQLKTASMMSNMMNLQHQSAMSIINNIR